MTSLAHPHRLLVVDANDEARTFLRRRFSGLGYQVLDAAEHATALLLLASMPFDLVLLDLQTPGPEGESGFDLLRRMREQHSAAALPVLAIAAASAAEDAVEALLLGADDCLVRPLHIPVAQARAEMLIRRRDIDPAARAARADLEARLDTLGEAAERSEAVSAALEAFGPDLRSSLNGLLGATSVLTQICQSPDLAPAIERIEAAAATLDTILVRELGRADRRIRAPKLQLKVLLVDDPAGEPSAARAMLETSQATLQLAEVSSGAEAVRACDVGFFDLMVVDLGASGAVAAIHEIRRTERQNRTRRTPVLAVGERGVRAAAALEAGADLHVRGPVTPERLLSALAEELARESDCVVA